MLPFLLMLILMMTKIIVMLVDLWRDPFVPRCHYSVCQVAFDFFPLDCFVFSFLRYFENVS